MIGINDIDTTIDNIINSIVAFSNTINTIDNFEIIASDKSWLNDFEQQNKNIIKYDWKQYILNCKPIYHQWIVQELLDKKSIELNNIIEYQKFVNEIKKTCRNSNILKSNLDFIQRIIKEAKMFVQKYPQSKDKILDMIQHMLKEHYLGKNVLKNTRNDDIKANFHRTNLRIKKFFYDILKIIIL